MRTMYDSTSPALIPATAAVVAGYVSGKFRWSHADWARFHGVKIRIDVDGSQPWLSDVADCETGDLTPGAAARWAKMRQAERGWWSCIYTSRSEWSTVQEACRIVGATKVVWWIASWDGKAELLKGAVAKQYENTPGYDLSAVEPAWFKTSAPGWSVPLWTPKTGTATHRPSRRQGRS